MKLSVQDMAVGSFVPMLESLSEILDKGAEHATLAKSQVGGFIRPRKR